MNATVDPNQAAADAAADVPEGFFFSLKADDTGVSELKFRKDGEKLHRVVLFTLEYINQTFDTPFPSVGDFCRHLGSVADQIEAIYNQEQQQQQQQQAQDAANDSAPPPPEPEAT